MKIEKNKMIFASVLLCIILFITGYVLLVLEGDEAATLDSNQIPIPELGDGQKEYESKLEALDDIKENREKNAPSLYNEQLLDSTGMYDPDLLNKEKMRLVDSIYNQGRINYSESSYRYDKNRTEKPESRPKIERDSTDGDDEEDEAMVAAKERSLEHQLFFASQPIKNQTMEIKNTDAFIYVRVDGTQIVKTDYRLQMRLVKNAWINGILYPKNTAIYGFVSFKPNRTMIAITNIDHRPVRLKAFDLQDGNEGVYVENSFRAEATNEVIGDMVDEINITGVPQVSGIRKIFQRNRRSVKVTITDNYQLVLRTSKPSLNEMFGKPINSLISSHK